MDRGDGGPDTEGVTDTDRETDPATSSDPARTPGARPAAGATVDLVVVGAGVLGLATAWQAHREGRTVHVIDRSDRPVGASVQNFGHACFTAQADAVQDLARVSAAGWTRAAADAGFRARRPGTVIPAVTPVEMQVIEEFRAHRGPEEVRVLDAAETARLTGAAGSADAPALTGGAHLPRDMRVNPREAVPALARWLARQGVRFSWSTAVHGVGDGVVDTSRGTVRGAEVVVCPGHSLRDLLPDLAVDAGVRTCTLTMALIARPDHTPVDLAMLTGTSMTRYDGIAAMPAAATLRGELAAREPELRGCDANLMATAVPPTPGHPGGVIVGDSHGYDTSPEPFIDAPTSDLLVDRAARYLGIRHPVVLQRWQGRYADSPSRNLVLHRPDARTTVAVVTSGIGMTLSFGIADLVLGGGEAPAF